jgi:hypothetical protein
MKTTGVKYGQDGQYGYLAFGSAGQELFTVTKERDQLKIESLYGGGMGVIVTGHTLPFLPTPVFADIMMALAIGDGIGVDGEFGEYLGTPGMAKSALDATRTPTTGATTATPLHAFGTSVTEATDENLVRGQHLNQYNRLVSDVKAHNRT